MELSDLYDSGRLTVAQLAEATASKQLEASMGMSKSMAQEALSSLLNAYDSMNSFVDDDPGPTEEELAIHLNEMDDLEQTLAALEES